MVKRQCSVQINNDTKTFVMCSPRVYIYSGRCEDDLPSTIGPSQGGHASFTKTTGAACGAVGIFTYDLFNKCTDSNDKKMAVMFSNPFNFNFYSNQYAVGIFDSSQPCDYNLFYKMYYETQTGFVRDKAGSDLTYSDGDFTISASMTDTYQPELTINLKAKACIQLPSDMEDGPLRLLRGPRGSNRSSTRGLYYEASST